MAKTDNFEDFLVDLANTIREKKGTTDLINPQDFSTEILSIQTGGSDEYGQSYYKITNGDILDNLFNNNFNLWALVTSVILDGMQVHRVATYRNSSDFNPISLLDIISKCEAFSLSNAPHTGVELYFNRGYPSDNYDNFIDYEKYTFSEGDLMQKMVSYLLQGGIPEEEVNAMIPELEEYLYAACIPITKEEFEALITSK
jgi:hypothetical protein